MKMKTHNNLISHPKSEIELLFFSDEENNDTPDGIEHKNDEPESVGDAVGHGEGVAESSGSSDVLLEKVATDDKAD